MVASTRGDSSDLVMRLGVVRQRILLGTVILVPLAFLRALNDPFNTIKFGLLVLGVLLAGSLRVFEGIQTGEWTGLRRLFFPSVAFSAPLVTAWVLAEDRAWSLFGQYGRLQGLVPYLVLVILGVLLADAFKDDARLLLWAVVISGSGVAAYAVVQALGLDPFSWAFTDRTRSELALSTLGNPNFVGGFLGMVLPCGVCLYLSDPERKTLLRNLLVLIVFGWLFSESQGGWAAGVAGVSVVGGESLLHRSRHARSIGLGLAAAVAIGVVSWVAIGAARSTEFPLNDSAALRRSWWTASMDMAAASPIVGHGPDAFASIGVRFRSVPDAIAQQYHFTDDPHSVPLDLLVGGGVLAVVGLATVLGWATRRMVQAPKPDLLRAGFFGGVTAYAVQALVSIDELSLRLLLWTCLAGLALPAATVRQRKKARTTLARTSKSRKTALSVQLRSLRMTWVLAPLSVLFFAVAWWCVTFVIADAHARQAHALFDEENLEEGQEYFSRALDLREERAYRREFAARLGIAAVREDGESAVVDAMRQQYNEMRSYDNPFTFRNEANTLVLLDLRREAVALYDRAVQLDRWNPRLRVEAAENLHEIGDHAEVEPLLDGYTRSLHHQFEAAAAEGLNFPQLWLLLAEARIELDDHGGAIDALERLAGVYGFGPEREFLYGVLYDGDGPKRNERFAPLWGYYAWTLTNEGDPELASQVTDLALELDPRDPYALRAHAALEERP